MLVESPNNTIDAANDRMDLDEKEIIMPTEVVKTASSSAGSEYPNILGPSNERVTKCDIPKTKNISSMSWFVSDASLIYGGYTASTPNVIA